MLRLRAIRRTPPVQRRPSLHGSIVVRWVSQRWRCAQPSLRPRQAQIWHRASQGTFVFPTTRRLSGNAEIVRRMLSPPGSGTDSDRTRASRDAFERPTVNLAHESSLSTPSTRAGSRLWHARCSFRPGMKSALPSDWVSVLDQFRADFPSARPGPETIKPARAAALLWHSRGVKWFGKALPTRSGTNLYCRFLRRLARCVRLALAYP